MLLDLKQEKISLRSGDQDNEYDNNHMRKKHPARYLKRGDAFWSSYEVSDTSEADRHFSLYFLRSLGKDSFCVCLVQLESCEFLLPLTWFSGKASL